MARDFSSSSLIQLPRLNAISTARLLTELINAANAEKKLPAAIAPERDELVVAHTGVEAELTKRLLGEGQETPKVRAADSVEDNAFGALFDWLASFARLPDARHPAAAKARAILQAVFPNGLAFLAIAPRDEWQEAELRLGVIAKNGSTKTIHELGGKPFLDELEVAHKAYGEALGITAEKTVTDAPQLRVARDEALDVIREYVLRVMSHVRKKDPQTRALADRLLAPLIHWSDRPTREGAQDEAPAAEPPAADASPPKG